MKKIYTITFGFLVSVQLLTAQTTQTFNYTGSQQTFTIPACVSSIVINASGAQGGTATYGPPPAGGLGANIIGTFAVTPGQVLNIMVGQMGINGSGGCGNLNGGGGGGSFVWDAANSINPLIAAGGGGGSGSCGYSGGGPGLSSLAGPGLGGNCGPCNNGNGTGGGGAGWNANGQGCKGTAGCGASAPALSPLNGGTGGTPFMNTCYMNGPGGFSGGGAGGGNCGGGGGGGGYNGGDGGGNVLVCQPGSFGGTSYNGGTNQTNTSGTQSNDGIVTITYFSSAPPTPGIITGSSSVCANATGNYSIVPIPGATTYTWTVPPGSIINSGQGTTSINITAGNTTGNISVTVTVPCGTSSPSTFVLTIIPAPTVTATSSSASVCIGGSVTLTGGGASTYTWNNNVIDAISFIPTATTTYIVTGTDANGCVNTATTTVTVNPLPVVTANSSSALVCTGSSLTLTGGGASTYTWDNNVMNAVSFVPTATTTYMVTGTDANGCVNTATTTVTVNPLPIVTANSSAASVCAGAGVTLTGGGASTYTWNNNVIDAISFVPTATTTYMVTGTDANGCSNTATLTVTVNPLPIVTATSSAASVCTGGSVTLTGGGALTYTWDNNVINAVSFIPTTNTTYMVTGTDANGCTNTATVTVTLGGLLTVNLGPNIIQCGGTAMLDAGNIGAMYIWNNASTTQTISVSASGTYIVVVTDANGCTGSDTALVTINNAPAVTASASSVIVCVDDAVVTLTGTPTGGVWSGPGVTGFTLSPVAAGVGLQTAVYSYTDANGCEGIASVNVQVNACVGFVENTLANGVSVYPNPNNGSFTLGVNANVGALTIKITDMQGRVVYASVEKNVSAGFVKQISLDTQSSGMYLMHIIANGEQQTKKISVQK